MVGEVIVYIVFFLLLVVVGPWVVAGLAARRARRAAQRVDDISHQLEARISNLELTVRELRKDFLHRPAEPAEQPRPATVAAHPVALPAVPVVVPPLPAPPRTVVDELVATVEQLHARQESKPLQPAASIATPPPKPTAQPPAPTPASPARARVGLEEKLGTNWLNKVGIVLLVLGVAFLLSTLMQTLGPAGKVLLGYAVGGALLGAGVWFEKRETYRVLARAGIGGGWALLFFTTYALNHVAAARVMSSPALDAVLMLVVAAAMLAHTLRYDSQVVTGLAFLLAFATVTISTVDRVDVYSLTAGLILALAVSTVALKRQWYELEVFGILATYGNHWLWLRPIIEPMGARHHAFPEFRASAAMLLLYWLIFRISYVLRGEDGEAKEQVSTLAALLNTGLLLGVMKYQSLHPEWAAWFLLALGALEVAFALVSRARRRMAFVVLATVGSALMVAAIPFRYSGTSVSLLWLLECETLFLAGVFTREIVFRRLGLLATLPVVVQMVFLDQQRVTVAPDPRLGAVFAFGALMFFIDAHLVQRRWPELFQEKIDRDGLQLVSVFGALIALLAFWVALPDAWIAVGWALLGLALAFAGKRWTIDLLRHEAYVFAGAALLRALLVNIEVEGRIGGVGLRVITLALIAALLYLTAPWTSADGRARQVPSLYTWAASLLVVLLCWYELQPVTVALAWALFGLVVLEIGLALRRRELRFQGYAAFTAAFTRVFFVNLNAVSKPGELSALVYSTLPIVAVFLYAYSRMSAVPPGDADSALDRRFQAAPVLAYFGVVTLAAIVRFELNLEWVVAGWAALALALIALAWWLRRRIFLEQSLLMAAATAFRAVFHNFTDSSYFTTGAWSGRLATTGIAAVLLFAALPLAFALQRKFEPAFAHSQSPPARAIRGVLHHPEQVLWFLPLMLVTALLALEMRKGMITVSWGIEGVAVFLLALWIGERSYRLSGLGLLLLCVGKIVVVDVWELSSTDRYLTFIVMGSALLLVSFLYSRYREALRQYL